MPHDPNHEDMKAQLSQIVDPSFENAMGDSYAVDKLDLASSAIRQSVAGLMRVVEPDVYAEYRQLKYAGGPHPDLATRKKAYQYLFHQFIDRCYHVPGC